MIVASIAQCARGCLLLPHLRVAPLPRASPQGAFVNTPYAGLRRLTPAGLRRLTPDAGLLRRPRKGDLGVICEQIAHFCVRAVHTRVLALRAARLRSVVWHWGVSFSDIFGRAQTGARKRA